jgi:hypothetical protein
MPVMAIVLVDAARARSAPVTISCLILVRAKTPPEDKVLFEYWGELLDAAATGRKERQIVVPASLRNRRLLVLLTARAMRVVAECIVRSSPVRSTQPFTRDEEGEKPD